MTEFRMYPQSVVWEITFACNMRCIHQGGKERVGINSFREVLKVNTGQPKMRGSSKLQFIVINVHQPAPVFASAKTVFKSSTFSKEAIFFDKDVPVSLKLSIAFASIDPISNLTWP